MPTIIDARDIQERLAREVSLLPLVVQSADRSYFEIGEWSYKFRLALRGLSDVNKRLVIQWLIQESYDLDNEFTYSPAKEQTSHV